MPNGRSGGFLMQTADLKRLFDGLPDSANAGQIIAGYARPREASLSEIAKLVGECAQEKVPVEEQDGTAYIVHLSNEPILWLFVFKESRLLDGLKRSHAEFLAEHPRWNGWIAF
jgi:hypothetical protein